MSTTYMQAKALAPLGNTVKSQATRQVRVQRHRAGPEKIKALQGPRRGQSVKGGVDWSRDRTRHARLRLTCAIDGQLLVASIGECKRDKEGDKRESEEDVMRMGMVRR